MGTCFSPSDNQILFLAQLASLVHDPAREENDGAVDECIEREGRQDPGPLILRSSNRGRRTDEPYEPYQRETEQ